MRVVSTTAVAPRGALSCVIDKTGFVISWRSRHRLHANQHVDTRRGRFLLLDTPWIAVVCRPLVPCLRRCFAVSASRDLLGVRQLLRNCGAADEC